MASFVYAVWSITNVASVHCSVRPEISPCTCEPVYANNYVELSCEKVDSFHKIVDALSNKFEPNISISLKISHSQLDDLEMRSFSDMNLNVVKLRLQWNGLRSVPELPFRGLSNVEFLSVGDNELEEIPKHVLNHLPLIKTLDMGRGRIRSVLQDDLKGIQMVTNLFLPSNNIVRLDKGSFPPGMLTLHLGRNQIESLNGSLRELHKLESLFINMNNIETLENELPESYRLKLILAQNNRLKQLPQTMKYLDKLETLHIQNNMLRSFDGVLKNAKNLNLLLAFNNEIEYLAKDEFQESELLEELNLSYNHIKSLNGSLLPMRRLFVANFSFNDIDEFSMNEIRGLKHLKQLDMSYNFIQKLTGRQENNIDQHSFLIEFNLDHNRLKSLDGALMGLNRLRILSLSHNQIERILPEDFIGLEKLELLELSHNHLMTLKEMATTFLPNLKILKVAFNNLTILEKDFHGLPILCQANLTNNQISSISQELVSETRCMNHNVPGKLEIFLENNPIICDHAMSDLCPMMISQKARIRGKCPPFNKEQEICDLPFIYPQDIPLIIKQLSHQALPPNGKPIIQLIVPSTNKFKKPEEILPPLLESLGGQPLIKPLIIPLTTSTSTTTTTTSTTTTTTTTTTPAPTTSTTVVPTTTQQVPNITMIEDISLLQSEVETPTTTTTTTSAPNTTNITMLIEEPATTTITYTTTTLLVDPLTSADVLPEDPPVVLDIAAAELPPSKVNQESTSLHLTEVNAASNAVIVASSSLLESDVHQTEYPTVEYIPNLDQFMPGNHPPNVLEEETNNSVHEEFPSVVLSDLDNAQQSLLIPAEPPENPKN